jgi:hypothetical protein
MPKRSRREMGALPAEREESKKVRLHDKVRSHGSKSDMESKLSKGSRNARSEGKIKE